VVQWLAENVFQYIAFMILPFLESWTWIPWYTIALLHVAGVIIGVISVLAMFLIWLERKVSAHIQDRLGPMRVGGWHGWAQSIADGIKLLLKEDIIPAMADRPVFIVAPFIAFAVAFMSFIVLPFSQHIIVADLNIGVLYVYGLSTITVIAIIIAGWASNNKWSLLGAVRSAAQLVSYEIPVGLSLLAGVVMAGSLSTVDISMQQSGGVWNWFIWRCGPFSVIAAILLYVGALAVLVLRRARHLRHFRVGFVLAGTLLLQVGLGIANVLGHVPLPVAIAHNGGAALLLLAVVTLIHALSPPLGAPSLAMERPAVSAMRYSS
jgi:heme A synthase